MLERLAGRCRKPGTQRASCLDRSPRAHGRRTASSCTSSALPYGTAGRTGGSSKGSIRPIGRRGREGPRVRLRKGGRETRASWSRFRGSPRWPEGETPRRRSVSGRRVLSSTGRPDQGVYIATSSRAMRSRATHASAPSWTAPPPPPSAGAPSLSTCGIFETFPVAILVEEKRKKKHSTSTERRCHDGAGAAAAAGPTSPHPLTNGRRGPARPRVEPDVVLLASPLVLATGHQVEARRRPEAPIPSSAMRHEDERVLDVERVEVDGHQDDVRPVLASTFRRIGCRRCCCGGASGSSSSGAPVAPPYGVELCDVSFMFPGLSQSQTL